MQPKRYTNTEIFWIDYYFDLDEKMSLYDWIKLTLIRWFNRKRYDRFYNLIVDGIDAKEAFSLSKIKEHEIIF